MANVFHRYLGKDGKMPKLSPEQRKEQARRNKLAAELTTSEHAQCESSGSKRKCCLQRRVGSSSRFKR
jgi:hypothetical protein